MHVLFLKVTSLTLDKQIKFFHRTVKHNLHKMFNEKEKMEKHLSESLFFVSTGVNDYFHNGTFRGNKNLALFLLNEFTLRIQVCDIKLSFNFDLKTLFTHPGICDIKSSFNFHLINSPFFTQFKTIVRAIALAFCQEVGIKIIFLVIWPIRIFKV